MMLSGYDLMHEDNHFNRGAPRGLGSRRRFLFNHDVFRSGVGPAAHFDNEAGIFDGAVGLGAEVSIVNSHLHAAVPAILPPGGCVAAAQEPFGAIAS